MKNTTVAGGVVLFHNKDKKEVCYIGRDKKKGAALYWFMHTPAQITISADGRKAILTIVEKQLEATLVTPATARFTVLPAAPLPSSPQPAGINKNEGIQRLTIQLNGVQEERIVVEVKQPGQTNKSAAVYYQPLNQWKKS